MAFCLSCGAGVDETDSGYYSRNMQCIPCYIRKTSEVSMISCSRCGTRVRSEEARQKSGSQYCSYCASEIERIERMPNCALCSRPIQEYQQKMRIANGQLVHTECAQANQGAGKKVFALCAFCGASTDFFKVLPGGRPICAKCDRAGASEKQGSTIISSLIGRIGAMLG